MAKSKIHPMASKNIDAYLSAASDDQRPILELLRSTIGKVDARLKEDWKWGAPCFNMDGLVCWFIGFKNHVGLNFFKGALIKDTHQAFVEKKEADKGNRMMHFNHIDEVNTRVIEDYVKQAIKLNEQNIAVDFTKKEALKVPDYFESALNDNKAAGKVFGNFTEAQKRDYVEWLTEAKRESTRDKRLAQAIEWIAEGKTRNWKYMKC